MRELDDRVAGIMAKRCWRPTVITFKENGRTFRFKAPKGRQLIFSGEALAGDLKPDYQTAKKLLRESAKSISSDAAWKPVELQYAGYIAETVSKDGTAKQQEMLGISIDAYYFVARDTSWYRAMLASVFGWGSKPHVQLTTKVVQGAA